MSSIKVELSAIKSKVLEAQEKYIYQKEGPRAWLTFIEKKFDERRGSSISEARVVVYGVTHSDTTDRRFVKLVNEFSKPGDIILLESVESGKEVSADKLKNLKGFKAGRRLIGWDNERAFEKLVRDIRKLFREDKSSVASKSDLRLLRKKLDDTIIETTIQRDASLVSTILNFINPTSKIFVYAGLGHIIENKEWHKLKRCSLYVGIDSTNFSTLKSSEQILHNISE